MEPIKSIQTKDYIAELLRKEIISGNMVEGDELTQELIAEKLGVSRMPVREALQLLENEGFLTRLPNRHIKVNGIKAKNIMHYLRAINAIEAEIAIMLVLENKEITSIETAFEDYITILSSNSDRETFVEKEITIHKLMSVQLNDAYIENLHKKMLNNFLLIRLRQKLYNYENSSKILNNIIKNINDKDINNIRNNFNLYYEEIINEINLEEK
nr:GntR family transcriptional regulator [Sedimentibacter sp.]